MDTEKNQSPAAATEHVDVAIVGGRCAGAATARLLASRGLSVLVIDRASFPSDTLSTHSIAPHGVELLDQWGLLDPILATGVPNPRALGVRVGGVDLPTIPVPPESRGTLAPRRVVLDALLLNAARVAGAQAWEETTVLDLLRDGDRVIGVQCRGADGRVADVRASLVIGADGVNSRVARTAGATHYDVQPSRLAGIYAYYSGTGLEQNELGLADGLLSVAFPTNDGLTVIAIGADESRFAEIVDRGDAAMSDLTERSSPRIGTALRQGARETRFFAYRPNPNRFVQPHGPGWALVGDAGLHLDPITGQGIANAFLSAELLANALSDGVNGTSATDARLADFRKQRDALLTDIHRTTSAASALEWNDEQIVHTFLEFRAASEATTAAVRQLGVRRRHEPGARGLYLLELGAHLLR